MSGGEIIVIFLVMLLLFGSKKLPDLARTLGKGMREFQRAKDEIQNELTKDADAVRSELAQASHSFQNDVDVLKEKLSSGIEEIHSEIKPDEMVSDVPSDVNPARQNGENPSKQ